MYYFVLLWDFFVMLFVMLLRSKRYQLSFFQSLCLFLFGFVGAASGTKILFILENFQSVLENGITLSGFSFFGCVFFVPVLMLAYAKIFQKEYSMALDAVAPLAIIGIGIMRIGCYLDGCCGGKVTELFGMEVQWPTQLMELICDFAIAALLLYFEKNHIYEKLRYCIFAFLYGFFRFIIEFFRDTTTLIWKLTNGQVFALLSMIVALFVIVTYRKKQK